MKTSISGERNRALQERAPWNKRNKMNRKQVKATSVGTPNTLPGKKLITIVVAITTTKDERITIARYNSTLPN